MACNNNIYIIDVVQHIKRGDIAAVGFHIDENIQKMIKKTIRIFNPFWIVKFECFDQF